MKRLIGILFIFLQTSLFAQVEESYYYISDAKYDPAIPTPSQFLGYTLGTQHVSPYETYAYMRKLAELSPRITVEVYGKTYENRELLLLTVTSPRNHQKLTEIKEKRRAIIDGKVAKEDLKNIPLVIWMGYSVHGNEASGQNSSLLSAYHLAAAQGDDIEKYLENTVVLIDPCINPDGGNRFATWVNHNRSQTLVSDPSSREFSETWPGGRTNHYWFDMNRDWLYQQLPESKGRLAKYYEWWPNILTDHHEMGSNSTFFFQPGVPERTNPMTPVRNIELTKKIGTYHAKGLDKIGSLYYSEQNYDDFYYGKGSTLPDINGAVGILFEQGSSRGHLQETNNGLLSFPATIRNQFSATLSTLKAGGEMHMELMEHMQDFYKNRPDYGYKTISFGDSKDPIATWEMVQVMLRNKIQVYAHPEKKGIFLVPSEQPQKRLIHSLFEKRTTFTDSAFYDISAWTLPLCMNVPYSFSTKAEKLGELVQNLPMPSGKLEVEGTYAYLFDWNSYYAPRALYQLQKEGYLVKVARSPFEVQTKSGPRKFDFGSILIMPKNKDTDASFLETLAKENALHILGLGTGNSIKGSDLGSETFLAVKQPKPLLIVGDGVSPYDAGEVWHLLDTRMHMPVSMVDVDRVSRLNLADYTHIIMVNGSFRGLSAEKVKSYVNAGGIAIGISGGASWLANNGISSVKIKAEAKNMAAGTKQPYNTESVFEGAMETAGTIFEVNVDPTHPICYGYDGGKLSYFKVNNICFEDTKDPYNTPLMYTGDPLMAGYVHPRNLERIKGSPALIAESSGRGKVISFSDNPNFRAFWYGTNKFFLNALFFGSVVNSGRYGE